jgi:hypothetical protein
MRLFGVDQASRSPGGAVWGATALLRLPLRSFESSKSSVLENQVKGAVTMFLIVPKKEEFERVSGRRFFKGRRRWLEGELDEAIVKDSEQQQMSRLRVTVTHRQWTCLLIYCRSK